jgi:hypothetical protein
MVSWFRAGTRAGHFEHGNEPTDSINGEKFLSATEMLTSEGGLRHLFG